jgi:hypothetical protein
VLLSFFVVPGFSPAGLLKISHPIKLLSSRVPILSGRRISTTATWQKIFAKLAFANRLTSRID